jgi:phosphoribosylformylglycinamidine synthase
MREVVRFAEQGGVVIGICNGFQILLEAGLLPGVMLRNASLRFVCTYVTLRVENARTFATNQCTPGELLRIPVAHGDGNYFADADTLGLLEARGQIVFRYSDAAGNCTPEVNPNGSVGNIAGIINDAGNVLGMMPHPERASDPLLGYTDGRKVFESILSHVLSRVQRETSRDGDHVLVGQGRR